jgi:hypothetical protein
MPLKSEGSDFFASVGVEYEANARIPIYWLFLFGQKNIVITNPDDINSDPDARPYAYLISDLPTALVRLKDRQRLVESLRDSVRMDLFLDWTSRLRAENFTHVIVKTEELSWFGEEELTRNLNMSLALLDRPATASALYNSDEFQELTGFLGTEKFCEMDSEEIVGRGGNWPLPLGVPKYYIELPKKKWWHFWRWL